MFGIWLSWIKKNSFSLKVQQELKKSLKLKIGNEYLKGLKSLNLKGQRRKKKTYSIPLSTTQVTNRDWKNQTRNIWVSVHRRFNVLFHIKNNDKNNEVYRIATLVFRKIDLEHYLDLFIKYSVNFNISKRAYM